MNRERSAHFPSFAVLIVITLLFSFLLLMSTPSPVFAREEEPPTPPTITFIIKSLEKNAHSCTYQYAGDNAETCSGYFTYPCTCTINCPSCLTEEDTCIGLSVGVINNICGNSGWQEADRVVEWHYYTVEKRITRQILY